MASPSKFCLRARLLICAARSHYFTLDYHGTATALTHKIMKLRLQTIITIEQMLRHDASFGDDRHKVCVTLPARHDVPMQMISMERRRASLRSRNSSFGSLAGSLS